MRPTFGIVCFLATVAAGIAAPETMTPEALLQRGVASYRAAHYAEAAKDLDAAAQALLSPEQMQTYVNSGKFANLDKFETALVYLTLAESKLGHDDRAREAVLRLVTAERISNVYGRLPLEADAAQFEAIAARLVPGSKLTPNAQLVQAGAAKPATPPPAPAPAPTTTAVASTKPVQPPTPPPTATSAPAEAAMIALPPPSSPPSAQPQVPVQPTLEMQRAERQRVIDELVAQERVKIQKEADERIAADRAAAQKEADARIAADRAAAQKAADERIAAERAAAQKEADARVAAAQKAADERIAAIQREAEARIAESQTRSRREFLAQLRQADAFGENGQTSRADDLYNAIAKAPDAPREIVAEAAVGLYRIGAFGAAANAFRKLGAFAKGEEDLRYYNAVSLYESGDYPGAKRELACALPFIQLTDDVARYKQKIEASAR